MARPLRIHAPELIRHVMSRGNGKMRIFLDDEDYRQFVHLLGDVVDAFSIRCWNYCVMPNHYHATLQPRQANLSPAIRKLNGVYGTWWNRRHGRVGHVFQGRFKAQIVDRESYLVALSRYVVLNPVRAGIVKRPDEWPWSSYRATVGLTVCPGFLDKQATLRVFGEGDAAEMCSRFVEAVEMQNDDPGVVDRIRSGDRILGPAQFKTSVLETTGVKPGFDPGLTPV